MIPVSRRTVTPAIRTKSGPAKFAAITITIPTITVIVIHPSPVNIEPEVSSRGAR